MEKIIIADNATRNIVELDGSLRPDYYYEVGENSSLTVALLVRNAANLKLTINMTGKGGRAVVAGFIYAPDQNVTLTTLQHHQSPETTSNLLVKSVLDGKAYFDFSGSIKLEKTAQKTDAYQKNENLLVSKTARAQSHPVLEILANDVKCTHGVATGRFNSDELWYLTSRGITEAAAKKLLIRGFWEKGLELIVDNNMRIMVADRIGSWL